LKQTTPNKIIFYTFLTVTAVIISVLLTESIVRFVCNFPPTGMTKSYHIYPNDFYDGGIVYENIYKRGAKYFNTEDGYKVFKKNNYGLPGLDISDTGKKNIIVLGNSYLESRATPPPLLATSVFMRLIQAKYPNKYQVVNLGLGGQTPYLGLYRLKFWSKKIKPDYVLLVLEGHMLGNIERFADSTFAINQMFGSPITDLKLSMLSSICAFSAFANVIRCGIKYAKNVNNQTNENDSKFSEKSSTDIDKVTYNKMLSAILEYNKQYGDRFLLFSLLDSKWNEQFYSECTKNSIRFSSNSRIRKMPDFHMKKGHFNNEGNKELGYELYRFFKNTQTLKRRTS